MKTGDTAKSHRCEKRCAAALLFVKRAAAAGLGLGMVSSFGAAPDVKGGYVKILPVKGWDCRRPLSVFYREGEHLPAAQRAFLEFLRVERPMPPGA